MDKIKTKRIILIFLLIIIAVLFRVQYRYPHHPDHFTWGTYTNEIIKYGYVPWVMHPASLFGYYPLSIPSGFEFFFSYMSLLTGLELPFLFFWFSIFFGLFGGLTTFILMKKWTSFTTSFIASLVLLTMSFYAKVTSNTGSNRIFNIVLYPLFIVLLFKIYETWSSDKKTSLKYIISAILIFILMALIHRMVQLSIIFIVSLILAAVLSKWEKILEKFQNTQFYQKRNESYEKSRLHIIIDILLLFILLAGFVTIKSKIVLILLLITSLSYYFFVNYRKSRNIHLIFIDFVIYALLLISAKVSDLLTRGRLLHHIDKIIKPPQLAYTVIIVAIGIAIITIILIFSNKIFKLIEKRVNKFFIYIENKPEKSISIGLFLMLIWFLVSMFTKGGFFNMDNSYYQNSFILQGTSSWIIITNLLFNLNNNLTILIWFSFIGIVYLFFSKNKTIYHYFFIFVAIFFSQLIFDWEYIRLYMNPIYAIFIALGLNFTIHKITSFKPRLRTISTIIIVIIFCLHFFFSIAFMHREGVLDQLGLQEKRETLPEEYYITSGKFLSRFKNISILPSIQSVRNQRIAYYAKIPEAVIAQSVYTKNKNYNITKVSANDIWDNLKKGDKIKQIFKLQDWIMGGGYYHGKHIFRLTNNNLLDKYAKEILTEYNIRYIIDSDIAKTKFKFFESIQPIKNKIYTNPHIDIYDLEKGKQ